MRTSDLTRHFRDLLSSRVVEEIDVKNAQASGNYLFHNIISPYSSILTMAKFLEYHINLSRLSQMIEITQPLRVFHYRGGTSEALSRRVSEAIKGRMSLNQ